MQRHTHPAISVVLLDDHPMIRLSFEFAVTRQPDIKLLGSFSTSRDLMSWLPACRPDVLVLDYMLDDDELDGLSLIRQIRARFPDIHILMTSSMESLAVIHAALLVGVKGYINKREETKRYFDAIRAVAANGRFIPDNIAQDLSQMPTRNRNVPVIEQTPGSVLLPMCERINRLLTPREAEVIRLYLDGMSVIDIAGKLKRSRKTISGHKQTGMKKLGLSSDPELFKFRDELFK
ncbi:response regulator transcription factor [Pantoea sp. Taur]|uniref:response regulator transcription factor n=1 Tax=Pantoea sp. Taur TaxID=2576757 RepID=UPI0013541543|nr:response regulator transcription factor [Pantoea sp. Taur]MXP57138.1 response regulator transcription factor [Pantoea sp. Taur]